MTRNQHIGKKARSAEGVMVNKQSDTLGGQLLAALAPLKSGCMDYTTMGLVVHPKLWFTDDYILTHDITS